jgi:glycosyltransferase involved in cell wall biosynthesis
MLTTSSGEDRGRPEVSAAPRLVQVAEYTLDRAGSFIPMLIATLERARADGWAVEAVLPAEAQRLAWIDRFDDAGIPVRFSSARGRRSRARWLAAELSGYDGPTVLHSHFTTWDVPVAQAARRLPRTAAVWHIHSTLRDTPLAWLRNAAKFGLLGRRVAAILCPAENIVDGVRRRLAPRARVHFLPSAIEAAAFPMRDGQARQAARAELDLPAAATVLLHFGWHWHLKGGDIFLATVRELQGRGASDLVGLERGGDATATAAVEREGLADVVQVIPPVDDVSQLFAAADVLVCSSRSEGMAYAVLESLCSGTPVVATDIPGHAYIGKQVAACRITTRDPADLAGAIEGILARDPAKAGEDAAQARAWVAENLSYEANAERLLEIYNDALGELSPARG